MGGPDPVDELDEICRNWFKCRNCNDRLVGGSCNVQGTSSREMLLAGEYTVDYNQTSLDEAVCVNSNGDQCSDDTCLIDLYYAKQIRSFMISNGGANSLSPVVVSSNATCSAAVLNDNERICEGSAPYLYPKIVVGASQFLLQNSNQGWVGASNAVYKRFYSPNISWEQSRVACLNLGNGAQLAAIKNQEEQNAVASLNPNKDGHNWIGGYDHHNEGLWTWQDGEIATYFAWSAGQPDNASNDEDCLEMTNDGSWNDFNCGLRRNHYICEYRFES